MGESFQDSIGKILEGMEEFEDVVKVRVKSSKWSDHHKRKIVELEGRVKQLELELREFQKSVY